MKLFFKSTLFVFFLSLSAYILFFAQWFFNYTIVWYANLPEETQYITERNFVPGRYIMLLYLMAACFMLFLVPGIIYVVTKSSNKWLRISLAVILSVSVVFTWNYSVMFKGFYNSILMLLNMVAFVIAIYGVVNKKPGL